MPTINWGERRPDSHSFDGTPGMGRGRGTPSTDEQYGVDSLLDLTPEEEDELDEEQQRRLGLNTDGNDALGLPRTMEQILAMNAVEHRGRQRRRQQRQRRQVTTANVAADDDEEGLPLPKMAY